MKNTQSVKFFYKFLFTFLFTVMVFGANAQNADSATCYDISMNTRLGSRGSAVSAVQRFLIEKGYLIASVDGVFGQKTLVAAHAYQRANGITPVSDGSVGPLTRAKIKSQTCSGVSSSVTYPNINSNAGYVGLATRVVAGCQPGFAFSTLTGQLCPGTTVSTTTTRYTYTYTYTIPGSTDTSTDTSTSTTDTTSTTNSTSTIVFSNATGTPSTSASSLLGNWAWIGVDLGQTQMAVSGNRFVLKFATGGNVTSTTDCNSLGGKYTLNGSTINIGPLTQTLKYCQGSVEQQYSRPLSVSSSFAVYGDELRLYSSLGTMYFKKVK